MKPEFSNVGKNAAWDHYSLEKETVFYNQSIFLSRKPSNFEAGRANRKAIAAFLCSDTKKGWKIRE